MAEFQGCPGSRMVHFEEKAVQSHEESGRRVSQLRQWPVQLHLVSPEAPYYKKADVLLSADCVAYALADFHKDHLQGKALAIACPKLDAAQEIYVDKLAALIDRAEINTLTIMIMQVPCCRGLVGLVQAALEKAVRKVPVKVQVVSLEGEIISDQWL